MKKQLRFPAGALAAVLFASMGSGALQENTSGDKTEQLVFNAFVYDGHVSPAMGLNEQDFSVLIDKKPAKIDYFSNRDVPESIILLVQTSGSMSSQTLWQTAVNRLSRFVVLSNRASEFLVMTFNQSTTIVADWTSDREGIASAITTVEHVSRKGSTALVDSCVLAIKKTSQAGNQKKFVLLIANGLENNSKTSLKDFRRKGFSPAAGRVESPV